MFQGFAELASNFPFRSLIVNSSNSALEPDAAPTYRVYGPGGFLSGQSGSLSAANTGLISNATNATPIVITSSGHGLGVGDRVNVAQVAGTTAANGTWTVSAVTANTFTLSGSVGNSDYTSGGYWNILGLYGVSLSVTGANGYAAGEVYHVLVTAALSGVAWGKLYSFQVG